MPLKPYQTYVVAGVKDTLQNLTQTGFYLYSYEIDHQIRKDEISRAECLGVGEPKELTDGTKVVGIQYVGKLLSKGWFAASVKENGSVDIREVVSEQGEKIQSELKTALERAFKNQLINFHLDAKERWGDEWKFGFFLVKHPNPVSSKAYHVAKTNHEMSWNFDDSGKLVRNERPKSRYYRFLEECAFDMETGRLVKDGTEVIFGSYDGDLKSEFLRTLAKAEGGVVEKEELWTAMGIPGSNDEEKNDKLRSLFRIMKEYDFEKNLGIDRKTLEEEVLVCPPRRGYRFIGKFSDEP